MTDRYAPFTAAAARSTSSSTNCQVCFWGATARGQGQRPPPETAAAPVPWSAVRRSATPLFFDFFLDAGLQSADYLDYKQNFPWSGWSWSTRHTSPGTQSFTQPANLVPGVIQRLPLYQKLGFAKPITDFKRSTYRCKKTPLSKVLALAVCAARLSAPHFAGGVRRCPRRGCSRLHRQVFLPSGQSRTNS